MPKLRVPYAINDKQQLHNPETAEKGIHYSCPACNESVILKKGKIKVAHFAHKASENCNQETITHQTAKFLIQQVVSEWRDGKRNAPTLHRTCAHPAHEHYYFDNLVPQPIPNKVEHALIEYSLDGFRVDVALMAANKPVAVVEIRHTHAIEENKSSQLSVPFIELDATQVIKNPMTWESINDNFKPVLCKKCKKLEAKVHKIAQETGIEIPARYKCGLHECYKCQREILVFDWQGRRWSKHKPVSRPIPWTIQYRFSNTVGHEYWINTCPHCKAIQGDWFLGDNIFVFSL
jgi:hypothetical protein